MAWIRNKPNKRRGVRSEMFRFWKSSAAISAA